jgi:DNA-binding NarL/FixJ family response regulator
MTDPILRVLCVDDQRAFKDALRLAIGTEPDMTCDATASTVEEGLQVLATNDIDVVLMDLDLPDMDGIEGTRRIKATFPGVRVVVLTAMADIETFVRTMAAGADGFVAKDSPLEVVLGALRSRTEPGLLLDEETLRSLRDGLAPRASSGQWAWAPDLTEREREVLALLAAGIDPQTIARQLGIRVHTCRGYVRNVLVKLGAHSQLEAVAVARHYGLLGPTEEPVRPTGGSKASGY